MSVEFTHVSSLGHKNVEQATRFFFDEPSTMHKLHLWEGGCFSSVVVDGPGGILTNMDIAAEMARTTHALGIVLTHWTGIVQPTVAARQFAEIDRASNGRLSLRILAGRDGGTDPCEDMGHVEALRQTDEYLSLLKRLWSNRVPIDHEGPFYSVRAGFVPMKGPQGWEIPIRMGGVSGTAIHVAARHAHIFELAPGTPAEVFATMQRVRAAAAQFGRGGAMRFALPIQTVVSGGHDVSSPYVAAESVRIVGSPAHIVRALRPYAALGIGEFMIGGVDTSSAIAAFENEIAPALHMLGTGGDDRPPVIWRRDLNPAHPRFG